MYSGSRLALATTIGKGCHVVRVIVYLLHIVGCAGEITQSMRGIAEVPQHLQ